VHFDGNEGVITAIETAPQALHGALQHRGVGDVEGKAPRSKEHTCFLALVFSEEGKEGGKEGGRVSLVQHIQQGHLARRRKALRERGKEGGKREGR